MIAIFRLRRCIVLAGAAFFLLAPPPATAQYADDTYRGSEGYSGGSGSYSSEAQRGYGSGNNTYIPRGDTYPPPGGYGSDRPSGSQSGGYGSNDAYSQDAAPRPNDAYSPPGGSYGGNDAYTPRRDAYTPRRDAYTPRGDAYGGGQRDTHGYSDPGQPYDGGGYGEPYAPPPTGAGDGAPYDYAAPEERGTYNQNEIIAAGHGFFGAISQNLGSAVEYAFKSQGRPNGYILGEDAGGAFVVGLRYGEGRLYTKDAGDHKVFWQGPSVGYDAGAEGSKTMVLVYNLRDPSEIYTRFGGVQGSAYLVGGLSVQFQKHGDVTLAVIRSGVGVRLGANVGYLKYTRTPTWNPL